MSHQEAYRCRIDPLVAARELTVAKQKDAAGSPSRSQEIPRNLTIRSRSQLIAGQVSRPPKLSRTIENITIVER